MSILLFSLFGFLWYCVDVVIYGGAGSLKTFFSQWLVFQGLLAIWNLHFLIILYQCDTFLAYISLHVDIFLHMFVWEFLMRMLYLSHTYHVQSVYFSGIQESMICVLDRNQILVLHL